MRQSNAVHLYRLGCLSYQAILILMTEVDVTLTNYAVAAECACFAGLLASPRTSTSLLATVCMVFFSSIALAATAGGTVHGFFSDDRSVGYRILWPLTLVCMGITALAGLHIGAALLFSHAAVRLIDIGGTLVFFAYTIVVLFLRRDFRLAILNYLPPLIFMAGAFLMTYLREGKAAVLVGFLGVCIMLVAAAGQQKKWGVHPRYFNHNAVYHVLQALALWMIFIAAQESIRLEGTPGDSGSRVQCGNGSIFPKLSCQIYRFG